VGGVGFAARAVTASKDVGPELGNSDVDLDTDGCTHDLVEVASDVHVVDSPSAGTAFVGLWGGVGCLRGSTGIGARDARAASVTICCLPCPPIRNSTSTLTKGLDLPC
jgi:hypothetical protein